MPLDWPDQARFLEVIRSLRSASRSKLDEIVALARKDARKYYKHSVAILVKQIQVKKPRQRVPVLYAINSLCAAGDDDEVKKLFASRFSRDILKCVEAALRCPPQHLAGVTRVVAKWRRRSTFPPPIVAAANALLDGYAGWDPSLIDNGRDDDNKDTDGGFDVDDYVPSSDECSDGEGEDKRINDKGNDDDDDDDDGENRAEIDAPSADADDDEAGLTAAEPRGPPVKVPSAKKVRAWGAAPKRPERKEVQSVPNGTQPSARTEPAAEAKGSDEPLAWNPPPPSAPIATNPASNPPPPREVIGRENRVEGKVASNSSPPRRRSPPIEGRNSDRSTSNPIRGGAGAGKKGGGRDGDRGRDRRRPRVPGRREPRVEVDRWGDPVRRVSREASGGIDGYGGGADEPRRRSPPSPPPAAARARSPPKVRSPPRARSSSPERRAPKKQKKRAPLPPSPEKKRTPPR